MALLIIVAKWLNCTTGTFLTGSDLDTSFRVGIAMGQIAEFAFIIAALGLSLDVIRPAVYQVAVGAALLSVIVNPYLIRHTQALAAFARRLLPTKARQTLEVYTHWIHQLREEPVDNPLRRTVRRSLRLLVINTAFIAAFFMGAGYIASLGYVFTALSGRRGLLWLIALLLALPFYIVNFRKLQALGMLLAEMTVPPSNRTRWARSLRALVGALTVFLGVAGMALLTFMLGSAFLPSPRVMVVLLAMVAVVTVLNWKMLVSVYARAEGEVRDLVTKSAPAAPPPSLPATIGALLDREVDSILVPFDSLAIGKSIPDLQLRTATGATVVSIERGGDILLNPDISTPLQADDKVLVLGDARQVDAARIIFSKGTAPTKDAATESPQV